MGIFGALSTSVSGIRAQSYAFENISGNIANSQTTGFKRTDSSFVDLVPEAPAERQISGSVLAFSRATNTVQGDIQSSSVPTFMGINGEGYFIVQERSGFVDNLPVFTGVDLYSRRGDFQLDRSGFLVNGAGYYLKGLTLDETTGNPDGSTPSALRISNDLLAAKATSTVTYRGNIAKYPLTASADKTVANSELLTPSSYTVNPTVAGTGVVQANDVNTFLSQSIAGGAATVYDPTGNANNFQMRWAKISNTAGSETWNLFYQSNSAATGTATAWTNVGRNFVFDATGKLSPAISTVSLGTLTLNGTAIGTVAMNFGGTGVTQYADANGSTQVTQLDQNGYSSGELSSISIADGGILTGSYSNGRTKKLANIALATFNADNSLKKLDGGAFQATQDSGEPIIGKAGTIIGGSLESSNTDIADEFTKLIVTQQAYTANTRVVTTSNQMLQEVVNMIR